MGVSNKSNGRKKLRILEISSALDGGGVDKLLYEFCTRLMDKIHFDFVVTAENEGILEAPLQRMGCRIYHVPQMRGHLKKNISMLCSIIREGEYDIVHDHMNYASAGSMAVARLEGVPVRIAHAHTMKLNESLTQRIRRRCLTFVAKHNATHLCACSESSGKWMWGATARRTNQVYVMRNAIQLSDYAFSIEKRKVIRKEIGADEDELLIGNVARFSEEKNHHFLIEILQSLKNRGLKARLMLVGRGVLEDKIREEVEREKLSQSVMFMGIRRDVPQLLNAMDVFVLPSLYEGFPVTLVEAQANGLPVVVSDRVTSECVLSDAFRFVSIEASADEWAQVILQLHRHNGSIDERVARFDINCEAERLENFYFECAGRRN